MDEGGISVIGIFNDRAETLGRAFLNFAQSHAPIMMAAVLLLNLALKSWNLGAASLWCDEGLSAQFAQMGVKEIILAHRTDSTPPLYACALSGWNALFGNSEAALRSFSVVFSLLTAVILYVFAARHLNIQSAVFVSLLYAFSDIHAYYAQEMRTYALTGGLCALSVLLFYELLKAPNMARLAALGAVNALVIHSHYMTLFFLAAEFAAALSCYGAFRKGVLYYFLSQALSAALAVPWLLFVASGGYPAAGDISWLSRPGLSDMVDVFADFANGKFLLAVCAALMLASAGRLAGRKAKSDPGARLNRIFLPLLAFLPVIAAFSASFIQPVFNARYVLYASLGFFLLIAYLLSLTPWKAPLKMAVACGIVLVSWFRLDLNKGKGEDWKSAVPYVKALKTDQDLVVASAWYLYPCLSYYYSRAYFSDYTRTLDHLRAEKVYCMNDASGLKEIDFRGSGRIFMLQGHQATADPGNTLYDALSGRFKLEYGTNFLKLKLWVFSRGPGSGAAEGERGSASE